MLFMWSIIGAFYFLAKCDLSIYLFVILITLRWFLRECEKILIIFHDMWNGPIFLICDWIFLERGIGDPLISGIVSRIQSYCFHAQFLILNLFLFNHIPPSNITQLFSLSDKWYYRISKTFEQDYNTWWNYPVY